MRVVLFAIAVVLALGMVNAAQITKTSGYSLSTTWSEQRHYTYKKGTTPAAADYRTRNQFLLDSQTTAHSQDLLMLFSTVIDPPADSTGTYCTPGQQLSDNYATYISGDWVWANPMNSAGKYHICVCSYNSQAAAGDDCNYVGNTGAIDTFDFHFDQSPGFAHIIDSHSLTYVPSANQGLFFTHYTVMSNWKSAGSSAPQLNIPFITNLDSSQDKFYFATATSTADPRCAFSTENTASFGQSYIGLPTAGASGTLSGSVWKIPESGFAETGLQAGKSLICFCDDSAELTTSGAGCSAGNPLQYGAQVGFVHVVAGDTLRHVTVPSTASATRISLVFDAAIGTNSKAQFIADIIEVDSETASPFKFGACGTAHEDSSPDFVDGSTKSTNLNWDTTNSVGELITTTSLDGSSLGTARVCVCDSDIEQAASGSACSPTTIDATSATTVATSADYYGAQWGYIHKINMAQVGVHFTVLNAASQTLKITFDSTPASYSSTSHTPDATASGLPSEDDRYRVSSTCGQGAADVSVVSDIYNGVSGVTQTLDATSKLVTISGFSGASVGKKELCFCDQETWEETYSGIANNSCENSDTKYQHFGARIGFLHTIDSATLSQHVSIARGTVTGRTDGTFKLYFNTGFPDENDRVMLVKATEECGIDSMESTHVNSLTAVQTGGLSYQVEEENSSVESLRLDMVSISQATMSTAAKTRVCYCDSSVEAISVGASFTGCNSLSPTSAHYGTDVGFLHVVDIDQIPNHYTIGLGRTAVSKQFLTATFLTTPDVAGDKFYFADRGSDIAENRCGSSDPMAAPYDVQNELVQLETKHLTVLVDAADEAADLVDQTSLQKLPLCYCDASVEDVASCDNTGASFKDDYGAWLGYVHVVDMLLPTRLHWTLGFEGSQDLSVVFQGKVEVDEGSRFMAIPLGKKCGTDSADTSVLAGNLVDGDYTDGVSKTQKASVAPAASDTLTVKGLNTQTEGKVKLCFCDKEVEFTGAGDPVGGCDSQFFFGAWLGYLHVVRAKRVGVHHTIAINKMNAGDLVYSKISVEFLEAQEAQDAFTVTPIEYWTDDKDDIDYNAGSCGTYDIEDLPNDQPDESNLSPPGTGRGYPDYASTSAPVVASNNLEFEIGSSGRSMVAICFCDNSVEEESCGEPDTSGARAVRVPFAMDLEYDTQHYGAQVGFLHSVAMITNNFHSTIFVSGAADQNFGIVFDDRATVPSCQNNNGAISCPDWNDNQVRLVAAEDDCGLDESSSMVTAPSSGAGFQLTVVDNLGTEHVAVHPRTAGTTSTDDNQEVAFQLAENIEAQAGLNQKQLKICFCDYKLEGSSCASSRRFGAQAGFLHVIDAPQRSYSLSAGANLPKLTIEFATTVTDVADMRVMLVKATEFCGYKYATTTIEDGSLVQSLRNTRPTVGTSTDGNTAMSLQVGFSQVTHAGKNRICVCDSVAEGESCQSSDDSMFGLQMGWFHLVDIDEVGASYTIPRTNAPFSLAIEFLHDLNTPNRISQYNDQMMLIDWDSHCGESRISSVASQLGMDTSSRLTVTGTKTYDAKLTPNWVGRVHLCYCDMNDSVGGLQEADTAIERSSRMNTPHDASCDADGLPWHFGAELGNIYIIDVLQVPLQYTIAKNTDQIVSVTFQNSADNAIDATATGDKFMTVADHARCGIDPENSAFAADLNDESVIYQEKDSALEATMAEGVQIGIHTLCFCDRSIVDHDCGTDGIEDYGAKLGRLHVVDLATIPLHVTVVSSTADALISVEFLTAQGGEALDRFRLVGTDEDCSIAASASAVVVSESNLYSNDPTWNAAKTTLSQTVPTTSLITKRKLCFCDYSAETGSQSTECTQSGGDKHGAQLGYLHSVSIPATSNLLRHYSIPMKANAQYSVEFTAQQILQPAGAGGSTGDRFTLASMCGHTFTDATTDSGDPGQAVAVPAITGHTVTLVASAETPVRTAKTEICFCDSNVEGLDGTTETVQTSIDGTVTTQVTTVTFNGCDASPEHYGARVGFMHIVDVPSVNSHWTIAKRAQQELSVDFLTSFPDSWGAPQDPIIETRTESEVVPLGNGAFQTIFREIITSRTVDTSDTILDRFMIADQSGDCGLTSAFTTNIAAVPSPYVATTGNSDARGSLGLAPLEGLLIGKDALCYCDASAEELETCKDESYEHFGANIGTIHVVALHLDPPVHVTFSKANSQSLSVQFTPEQAISTTDRLRASASTSQCGSEGINSDLVTGDLATSTSYTTQNDLLLLADINAVTVGKARLCYCDMNLETSCASDSSNSDAFGAELGYLHVLDIDASSGHYSVSVAEGQEITIAFQSTETDPREDRLMAVRYASGCGKNSEDTDPLASLSTATYASDTANPNHLVATLAAAPIVAGKTWLCLCDFDVEGTCDNFSNFGAEAGVLHVVDVAAQRLHYTIGTDANLRRRLLVGTVTKTFDITFQTTADQNDMYKIVPLADSCAMGLDSVGPLSVSTSGSRTTLTVQDLTTAGNYRICLCDISIEGNCDNSVDTDVDLTDFGADIGTLHVVDIGKFYHYTIYNSKAQTIGVTFSSAADGADMFKTVTSAAQCGSMQEDQHVIALADPTADGQVLSSMSDSDQSMEVGEVRLCYCDHSTYTSGDCTVDANYGAQVATVHVAVPLVYPSIQTDTITAGSDATLNVTFTLPAEHSAQVGAVIEVVLPSGWGDGTDADVNSGIQVDGLVVDQAGSTTVVAAMNAAAVIGADVHSHCNGRQCISWEVGTNDILGGSLITFLVKSSNSAFKVPAEGAQSDNGAIYVYRSGSAKEIIETFVEPVNMPSPKDAETMYGTTLELQDTVKDECNVGATLTFRVPRDTGDTAQIAFYLPEGFTMGDAPQVSRISTNVDLTSPVDSTTADTVVPTWTVETNSIEFGTSKLMANANYQLEIRGICNRGSTYEESKAYSTSSAVIEVSTAEGDLLATQNDGIWVQRVTDVLVNSQWRMSSSIAGSSTVAYLTINIPEYVHLDNGYIRVELPVGWTGQNVKVDNVEATIAVQDVAGAFLLAWDVTTTPSVSKTFMITGLTVGDTIGPGTASISLREKVRVVPEKAANGVVFQWAHTVAEVVVTKDSNAQLPAVTAPISDARVVLHSTVTASLTVVDVHFTLPEVMGIDKLVLGDSCEVVFPDDWLVDFTGTTLELTAAGQTSTVPISVSGDALAFILPGDIDQGARVKLSTEQLKVPSSNAAVTGAAVSCSQKWTASDIVHYTSVTGQSLLELPNPTQRISTARIQLSNTRGGLVASAEHPNNAVITFISPVVIPTDGVVVVRFPEHASINVNGAQLQVNGEDSPRLTSFTAPAYDGVDLIATHPATVAFSPATPVPAGMVVATRVGGLDLTDYGVDNRLASEADLNEARIEVYSYDSVVDMWIQVSEISQIDQPSVFYPTIYPEFAGAWMYPSTTVQGSTGVVARVSVDLLSLSVTQGMTVSYKFPAAWGQGIALADTEGNPKYSILRNGNSVLDEAAFQMEDGSHVVSFVVGVQTLTGQLTFDVQGLELPSCDVDTCPGEQNDGWVQVQNVGKSVILSETVSVAALDVTQLITDARCSISDPRIGNPAEPVYVDLTVELTAPFEIIGGTNFRVTTPEGWTGVSSGLLSPVMVEPAGRTLTFIDALQAESTRAHIDVAMDVAAATIPSGTRIVINLNNAITVPSDVALIAQTPMNAVVEVYSTPIATHRDFRVVRASQSNLPWPPVAARIKESQVHVYFSNSVEGDTSETAKLEFAVPAGITIQEGYRVDLTFPDAWTVSGTSQSTWCSTDSVCASWFGDDKALTNPKVSVGVQIDSGVPATNAAGNVVSSFSIGVGSTEQPAGSIIKWSIDAIDVPMRASNPNQLAVMTVFNTEQEVVAMGMDYRFPLPAWGYADGEVQVSFSATGIGAEEVDAAVDFTNHAGSGSTIRSDGKMTLYFAQGVTMSKTTPPTLKWGLPSTVTKPSGRIIHHGDSTMGAIYEVTVGSDSSATIPSGADVSFEILGAFSLGEISGPSVMKQTEAGLYGDVLVQADVVAVPTVGPAVEWIYGRLDDLELGQVPSSLKVAFKPTNALTNLFGANPTLTIAASRTLWDITNTGSITAQVTSGVLADGCSLDLVHGMNQGQPDLSTVMVRFGAGSTTDVVDCIAAGAETEITFSGRMLVNPTQTGETTTFQISSVVDSHLQSRAHVGFMYGITNSIYHATPMGADAIQFTLVPGESMPTSSNTYKLTISSNEAVFPAAPVVSWPWANVVSKTLSDKQYLETDGVVGTTMYGKVITFTIRLNRAVTAGQQEVFTLDNLNLAQSSGTDVRFTITTTVATGTNNLELANWLSSGTNAQGFTAGPSIGLRGLVAGSSIPGANPESYAATVTGAVGGRLSTKFSQPVFADPAAVRRRLLSVGDATTITLGGGYSSCEVVPGSEVYSADGTSVDFDTQAIGGGECVPTDEEAIINFTGGLLDNSAFIGDPTTVAVSAEGAGSTSLITNPTTAVEEQATLAAITSNIISPEDVPSTSSSVIGTVVSDYSVQVTSRVGLRYPGSMEVRFTSSASGSMGAGGQVTINSLQPVFVIGGSPRVLLNNPFIGCRASAVAHTATKLVVTLSNFDGACSFHGSAEAVLTITDSTSFDKTLALSPNPGTDVAYSISTTGDRGTAQFEDQYLTYGFQVSMGMSHQLTVDETQTSDDTLKVSFTIRTSDGASDNVFCVAVSVGNNPGFDQIVNGQRANNTPAAGSGSAMSIGDGVTASILLEGLNDATPYDVVCAMQSGVVKSNVLSNQRTIGFVQNPDRASHTPQTTLFIADLEVARASDVTCVAVSDLTIDLSTSQLTDAFAYKVDQQTVDSAVAYGTDSSGASLMSVASAVFGTAAPRVTFAGLTEGTTYDLFCAIRRGQNGQAHILSEKFRFTTAGFSEEISASSVVTDGTGSVSGVTSTSVTTRCIAVPKESDDSYPTWNAIYNAQASDLPANSAIPVAQSTRGGVAFEFKFENLKAKTEYRVYCATINQVISPKEGEYVELTTLGSSGIYSDPHVKGSDGQFVDFFGDAGVYSLYESESMTVTGRFGLATAGNKMLFHPDAMKAGTMLKEAGVQIGDVRMRVALHAGGLVSLSDPMASTTFLTEDATLTVGDVTVVWTKSSASKSFPWGTHAYSAQLTLTAGAEKVTMHVAQAKGYHFLDVSAVAPTTEATGLLNRAMDAPAALATLLKAQREASFMVAPAGGDLFATLDCDSNPLLA